MVGRLNGVGGAHKIFLRDFFVTVGFAYSRWRSTVTDGGVDRYTSVQSHCMAQVSACVRHSISMPSMVSG